MKTTIEMPTETFRRAKTFAAAKGITLKYLVTAAVEEKIRRGAQPRAAQRERMKGFGALADLKCETARIMKLIEDEFEQIEAEDRP